MCDGALQIKISPLYIKWYTWELRGTDNSFLSALFLLTSAFCLFTLQPCHTRSTPPLISWCHLPFEIAFFSSLVCGETSGYRSTRGDLCKLLTFGLLWLSSTSLQLQSLLRGNVNQVEVDECVHADCRASGGCSTQLSISNSPSLLDSGALSLVSVKVTPVAVCGCAGREMTYRNCASYPTNPCLNGGSCTDTKNGYRWAAMSLQFSSLQFVELWGNREGLSKNPIPLQLQLDLTFSDTLHSVSWIRSSWPGSSQLCTHPRLPSFCSSDL